MSDSTGEDDRKKKALERLRATMGEISLHLEGNPPEQPPDKRLFLQSLKSLQDEVAAKAEVLSEAIELVAPALAASGVSLADRLASQVDPGVLTALFGIAADNARSRDWLKQKAIRIDGGIDPCGHHPGGPASGPVLGVELYLLEDGRIAKLVSFGLWKKTAGDELPDQQDLLVAADLIEPIEAVRTGDLMLMLMQLRLPLRDGEPLSGEPLADLADRRSRFDALVGRMSAALAPAVEGLIAAVRPPS